MTNTTRKSDNRRALIGALLSLATLAGVAAYTSHQDSKKEADFHALRTVVASPSTEESLDHFTRTFVTNTTEWDRDFRAAHFRKDNPHYREDGKLVPGKNYTLHSDY
ncbi:hypothetical protein FJZ17_02210 [Candidatus Pacearchaeota archaeon]|nr:hypothetical protein [Candidatus Pacearchaeota archaeon]